MTTPALPKPHRIRPPGTPSANPPYLPRPPRVSGSIFPLPPDPVKLPHFRFGHELGHRRPTRGLLMKEGRLQGKLSKNRRRSSGRFWLSSESSSVSLSEFLSEPETSLPPRNLMGTTTEGYVVQPVAECRPEPRLCPADPRVASLRRYRGPPAPSTLPFATPFGVERHGVHGDPRTWIHT